MNSSQKTVLVLGAGFTRAFFADAPLLEDEYDLTLAKFQALPHAKAILDAELNRRPRGSLNIERVMTRLERGMPYDIATQAHEEANLLRGELMRAFLNRVKQADGGASHQDDLVQFGGFCVDNRFTCVTFNYDDFFDRALYRSKPTQDMEYSGPCWIPDTGYGFYCRPSAVCVHDGVISAIREVSMHLLKLHGSVNWRVRSGSVRPYGFEAVVHHERWSQDPNIMWISMGEDPAYTHDYIESHLEPDPFVVAPLLGKSELLEQPVLRCVWSRASKELSTAARVIFLGYSFPVTDLAARFLFSEAVSSDADIRVVNLTPDDEQKTELKRAYKQVFPELGDDQFEFQDALKWCRETVASGRAS